MNDITRVLADVQRGEANAAAQLLPLIYKELRRLAAFKMAQEQPGHTLQATALVHEAYLRLVDVKQAQSFENRRHFFAAAAEAMRRILIENARQKARVRHGGLFDRVAISDFVDPDIDVRLLNLEESREKLAQEDPLAAQVIDLHHFAGLTHDQVAEILGISVYEARQKWNYARAWLKVALQH